MDQDAAIRKIRHMLEMHARDPDSEEAKTAYRLAGELMAKYDVAISDIKEKKDVSAGIVKQHIKVFSEKYWHDLEGMLASAVSEAFDMKPIWTHEFNEETFESEKVLAFIGHKSDMELGLWYFKYIRLVISRRTAAWEKDNGQHTQKAKFSYGWGMVNSVSERLHDMFVRKQEVHEAANTTALVIVKKDAVQQRFDEEYPTARKAKSTRRQVDYRAYGQGEAEGKKISLNKPMGGGSANERAAIS